MQNHGTRWAGGSTSEAAPAGGPLSLGPHRARWYMGVTAVRARPSGQGAIGEGRGQMEASSCGRFASALPLPPPGRSPRNPSPEKCEHHTKTPCIRSTGTVYVKMLTTVQVANSSRYPFSMASTVDKEVLMVGPPPPPVTR